MIYIKPLTKIVPLLLYLFVLFSGCSSNLADSSSGNEFKKTETFLLDNDMAIEVYLPEEYNPKQTYPVILFNDGETVFTKNGWNMAAILDELISTDQIEPVIGVAIYTRGQRNNWYIPYEDPWIIRNWGYYTPQAEEYATSIFEYVIPFLKKNYQINEDRIGILGASLGGLVSTWMGLKYPEKIKYSAGLSGSLWVADYQIFKEVSASYNDEQMFWFDIGTAEWNYYVPLYTALDSAGVEPGQRSYYYEVPDGSHSVYDWLNRVQYPLQVFFGTQNPEPESMKVVLECIPSAVTPGLKFRRMNPIITLSNGVKYSLAHAAMYSVTSGDIQLGSEGSFKNNPDVSSKVLIEYEDFSESVTIPVGFCR